MVWLALTVLAAAVAATLLAGIFLILLNFVTSKE